jgi:hypothetical protein
MPARNEHVRHGSHRIELRLTGRCGRSPHDVHDSSVGLADDDRIDDS